MSYQQTEGTACLGLFAEEVLADGGAGASEEARGAMTCFWGSTAENGSWAHFGYLKDEAV